MQAKLEGQSQVDVAYFIVSKAALSLIKIYLKLASANSWYPWVEKDHPSSAMTNFTKFTILYDDPARILILHNEIS